MSDHDPDLLAAFVEESLDGLETIEPLLVTLESASDGEPVEAIFRTVHSLKGNAAFFGFMGIKALAHAMESVFDAFRRGRLWCTAERLAGLLAGFDELRRAIEHLDDEAEVAGAASVRQQELIDALHACLEDGDGGRDLAVIAAELRTLAAELSGAQRERLARCAAALEAETGLDGTPGAAVGAGGGELAACCAELTGLVGDAGTGPLDEDRAERAMDALRRLPGLCPESLVPVATDLLTTADGFLAAMGFDPLLCDYVRERLPLLIAGNGRDAATTSTGGPAVAAAIPGKPGPTAAIGERKSMRIPEQLIDTFLHDVGELLVVSDMYEHFHQRLKKGSSGDLVQLALDLRRSNDALGELANHLHRTVMDIRKVPAEVLLRKVPRLVHEVARSCGKEVAVSVEGGELSIDKSLVDILDAPLTHMIRNSVDHGIEAAQLRGERGKPRSGSVRVSVSEDSRHVVVTIADDGGGIDTRAIAAKARELGMPLLGEEPTREEVVELLFSSGLSTAQAITETSGRGVGMDVVRRSVEEAGGRIHVDWEPEAGTTFRIELPRSVTTQIIPGYLVAAGGQICVLPLERVRRTLRLCSDARYRLPAGGDQLAMGAGERDLPLLWLDRLLGCSGPDGSGRIVVIVDSAAGEQALIVDEVIGVQKVVMRELVGPAGASPLLEGGALLGDGRIAMVLDLDRLAQGAHALVG